MDQPKTTGYAHFFLRITMGFNFFGHGFSRLPDIAGFRSWMTGMFDNSVLPSWVVASWATVLPFIEFAIGLLLIIGWFTRQAAFAGAAVISILVLGSCLIQSWEAAGTQMVYALVFYVLIKKDGTPFFGVDQIQTKRKENR